MFADIGHKIYNIHSKQKPAITEWGTPVTGERKEEYLLLFLQFSLILLLFYSSVWAVWGVLSEGNKSSVELILFGL